MPTLYELNLTPLEHDLLQGLLKGRGIEISKYLVTEEDGVTIIHTVLNTTENIEKER